MEAALVGIAGMGLTFGMWWVYSLVPSAPVLATHRDRALVWSYGQMLIAISIVATGAGLHVAAYFIEHSSTIGPLATVLSVAVPVGAFLAMTYALSYYLLRRFERSEVWLLIATAGVVIVSVITVMSGVSMARSLVILMLAPAVTVVGSEVLGPRQQAEKD